MPMSYAERSSGRTSPAPVPGHAGVSHPTTPLPQQAAELPERSALAFAIIAAGCELGLLANGLLRVYWGVNLALWVGAAVATMLWISHSRNRIKGDSPLLLALVAVCFA